MVQTVFDSDIDSFCRRYLVKVPGIADPHPAELGAAAIQQQTKLFENLLLFDKLSVKVTGESLPLAALIGLLGQQGFDSLLEQGAIEFVLWNQGIVHTVTNIPGLHAIGTMTYSTPEYNDPERSIDAGLDRMRNAPTGRKRRRLVRHLVPLFRTPPENLSEASVKAVNLSLQSGGLEPFGIPKVTGHADNLTAAQKYIVNKSAQDFAEYEFLLKNNITSFSDYRYFGPFWASAERFQTMNRTVAGFSAISEVEKVPDLKAIFHQIGEPLKRVSELRKTRNAVRFRTWLESTAGESPAPDMVRAYLDAISNRSGFMDSASGKILKTLTLAAVGLGVGTAAGSIAGEGVGAAAGIGSIHITKLVAEKLAEFVTESGIGILDSFAIETMTKGWSPRMYFAELSHALRSNNLGVAPGN
jgi:hypothetical protein